MEEEEETLANKPKTVRKRKLYGVTDAESAAVRERLVKRIILSLTKPSYVLGQGPNNLRTENRLRLRYLLRRLVKQHNWVEASGVLSAYLKGTVKDKSPFKNRFKYSVLLELLKHVGNDYINPTRIANLYDVWMKKNGSMRDWPVEDKYEVHLDFLLYCLMQGNFDEAHQNALSLKQETGVESDPKSNLVIGLTFYELWYSCIPQEFQWRDSDLLDSPGSSQIVGTKFSNQVARSEWHNSVESHMADSNDPNNSDTSVMNDKSRPKDVEFSHDMEVSMDVDIKDHREKPVQNVQPQGFYLNSEENTGNGDPYANHGGHMQDVSSLYALGGLDSSLLPLRLPDQNSIEQFVYFHDKLLNSYYHEAVKHLQLAVDSTPSSSLALLPLTQLLLIGGQVDEALNTLHAQYSDSASALPIRLRAALLERFDPNNRLVLSRCFEDILKKDPTCHDSLAKLIRMYQNGDYSLESLLEMIALHLDATYAECNTWREFALCFYNLSLYEEDCMSSFPGKAEDAQHRSSFLSRTPHIFTKGKSGKAWRLRCRWWLKRHFSNNKLVSEIEAGDLQLLTYKAACASHMYGQEFDYVVKAHSRLEKANDRDLLLSLDMHRRNSFGFYQKFLQR
ncbi:hypothetical protein L6164_022628 [Bauhinia variegata]|uniref:Uncharacterized protein n=1 Tax=Bauhinia variegata TaxID=167791 RepID=A0ACB9MH42_BAUVA|nr:hypothetical protein L6164_022628 [Bauhinia variegata]